MFRHIFRLPKACQVSDGTCSVRERGPKGEARMSGWGTEAGRLRKRSEEGTGKWRRSAPIGSSPIRAASSSQLGPRLSDLHLLSFRAHTETLVREALLVAAQALQ